MNVPLILLGLAGAGLSGYAWAAAMRPTVACAPGATCTSVFRRPEARLFGVPNALLGLLFSVAVIILGAIGPSAPVALRLSVAAASLASVGVGLYLVAVLVREQARCAVCLASHAVNALILLMLLSGS